MYKHRLTLGSLLFLGATSLACAAESNSAATSASAGQAIATLITQNYNNVIENCGEGKPAYLCSGITLRGTSPKLNRFALDPSPASVRSGGVSFSWLRKDAKPWKLAFNYLNGFIIYNKNDTSKNIENDMNYLCFYPEDAGTGGRADSGCGASQSFPYDSGPCQEQGVFTAEQWVEHFNKAPKDSYIYQHQCGFMISEKSKYDSADGFYQGILAGNILHSGDIGEQNEIRIATWDTQNDGYPEKFPVQAFFYIYNGEQSTTLTGSVEAGIEGARYDQFFLYQKTKRWVPIIRVTLPKEKTEEVKFEFFKTDQRILEGESMAPIMSLLL